MAATFGSYLEGESDVGEEVIKESPWKLFF